MTVEDGSEAANQGVYQRLIERLIYLSHTRPDISYAVNTLSQFMHSPSKIHLKAAYRVLRYLKRTLGHGLMFRKSDYLELSIYIDADFASSIVDRRSITGICSFLGENLIT